DEQSAADKKGPDSMAIEIFDANLFEPTALHDAGNADGIVAIALVDLHLQCGVCVPRINADDRQSKLLELRPKPRRCRAALEADADHLRRIGSNEVGDSLGLGRDHPFPSDLTGLVDNAHRGLLQRNVQSDVVLHRSLHDTAAAYPTAPVRGELIPCACLWRRPGITPCVKTRAFSHGQDPYRKILSKLRRSG